MHTFIWWDIEPSRLSPHALTIELLPLHHKDPFDRILIAQAKVEAMPFISRDAEFAAYQIVVEW